MAQFDAESNDMLDIVGKGYNHSEIGAGAFYQDLDAKQSGAKYSMESYHHQAANEYVAATSEVTF